MTADARPKLIYVAQRHPRHATHDAFVQRWRQHAALGMRQARWRNVALYLHCDRIDGLPPTAPAWPCDGVAVVVYRSEEARQAHIADEAARRTMKQDERDTFAHPVADTSLLVREEVVRIGAPDGYRLFVFRTAPDDGPAWGQRSGLLVGEHVGFTRNLPIAGIGGLHCACVDELTCARVAPLQALAALEAAGDVRMVLTRTVVLHAAP